MNSPYNLLQEIYHSDPWKSQVCCILLNCTRRVQVDRVRDELFSKYPDAVEMSIADPVRLSEILKPLGFYNRRAKTLIKFSTDWIEKDWKHPKELYGIGQYASDSWDIFYGDQLDVEPNDGVLVKYVLWKRLHIAKNHCTPISEN